MFVDLRSIGRKVLYFAYLLPNGLRYWRWGGCGQCLNAWGQEKLEARKMLENATESPASSAHFVRYG